MNCNLQSRKKFFIEYNADAMGSHPSTVARHIKIASELPPEAKEILRGAEKSVSSAVLKKIIQAAAGTTDRNILPDSIRKGQDGG